MSNYPHLNDDDERPEEDTGKGLPVRIIILAVLAFIGLYLLVSGWLGDRVDYGLLGAAAEQLSLPALR
ncbi:hypothetical protein [Nesterenkonia sp. NBAIMH1]|uniref:hypothetical protein n=1 Tax=Nesterenkonia sp. NBAIMH1 TaxID=2600320 RepID=UPI0011B3E5FD|nr:hypothetical protein [Nesterenkonia sp. NBAIMH1]